jgi:hypothetical protein
MRRIPLKLLSWLLLAGLCLVLLAAGIATKIKRWQEVDTISDEQKIARTLEIIRTSTPANRKVLKVLFYGQSITRSGWHEQVVAHWRQKYPNTEFVVQNRALGGFPSQALIRTTEQDIAAFYPDLIVFHAYGDHRAYEKIIRLFRSRTTADVILQTDHANSLPDPPCAEGFALSMHKQPGCSGVIWVHQRLWNDEMSYHKIPSLAKKYGLAVELQRIWWRDFLLRTHIAPESMLKDDIHPNEKGKAMIAGYFNQYFDNLVEHWNGETEHNVMSLSVARDQSSAGQTTVNFDGARLEILANKPLAAWPTTTVDGVPLNDIDGCYQVTRASTLETVPDWPAIRRISLNHDHVPEDWTATLTRISPDQTSFDFTLKSSVSQDGGSGTGNQNFVSQSGRLSIDSQDWMLVRAFDGRFVPLKAPYVVHWSVINTCNGQPEVIDLGNGAMQYRYLLAAGLSNGKHDVLLKFPPNDLADVTELRAYTPSLRQE